MSTCWASLSALSCVKGRSRFSPHDKSVVRTKPANATSGFDVGFLGLLPKLRSRVGREDEWTQLRPGNPLKPTKEKGVKRRTRGFLRSVEHRGWAVAGDSLRGRRHRAPGFSAPSGCSSPLLQPQWCCVQGQSDSRLSPLSSNSNTSHDWGVKHVPNQSGVTVVVWWG